MPLPLPRYPHEAAVLFARDGYTPPQGEDVSRRAIMPSAPARPHRSVPALPAGSTALDRRADRAARRVAYVASHGAAGLQWWAQAHRAAAQQARRPERAALLLAIAAGLDRRAA